MWRLRIVLLTTAVFICCQSCGSFVLPMGCPNASPARVRAMRPDQRRACVAQLLQTITRAASHPEPMEQALSSGDAVSGLAQARLIDDPSTIGPLINCLNDPLLYGACEGTLTELAHHGYGSKLRNARDLLYGNPPVVPARWPGQVLAEWQEWQRPAIADWSDWLAQMKGGHPIFDEWLESQCKSALKQLGLGLAEALRGTTAPGYLTGGMSEDLRTLFGWPPGSSTLFDYGVGDFNADNWDSRSGLDSVEVRLFRPGLSTPRNPEYAGTELPRHKVAPEDVYRETFPRLDLAVEVTILGKDPHWRDAAFLAARGALDGLRAANQEGS